MKSEMQWEGFTHRMQDTDPGRGGCCWGDQEGVRGHGRRLERREAGRTETGRSAGGGSYGRAREPGSWERGTIAEDRRI